MRGRVKMLGCCLKRPGNGRISVLVTIKVSQFSGITKSNFETDALIVDADVTFSNYGPKFEYENLKNTNNNNQSNFYDIVNTALSKE
jgi:hypothetical protein